MEIVSWSSTVNVFGLLCIVTFLLFSPIPPSLSFSLPLDLSLFVLPLHLYSITFCMHTCKYLYNDVSAHLGSLVYTRTADVSRLWPNRFLPREFRPQLRTMRLRVYRPLPVLYILAEESRVMGLPNDLPRRPNPFCCTQFFQISVATFRLLPIFVVRSCNSQFVATCFALFRHLFRTHLYLYLCSRTSLFDLMRHAQMWRYHEPVITSTLHSLSKWLSAIFLDATSSWSCPRLIRATESDLFLRVKRCVMFILFYALESRLRWIFEFSYFLMQIDREL